jgi:hypothetical protein
MESGPEYSQPESDSEALSERPGLVVLDKPVVT